MKRVIVTAAVLLVSTAAWRGPAHATEVGSSRTVGLGVQLFEPTALIGKVFLNRTNAIDFGVGFWSYGRCYDAHGYPYICNDNAQAYSFHFDFLYEDTIVEKVVRLDWHVGAGGRTSFGGEYSFDHNRHHDLGFFARTPVGIDLTFRQPAWLEAYLELAPGVWLFPPLYFDIDVGVGARAYF